MRRQAIIHSVILLLMTWLNSAPPVQAGSSTSLGDLAQAMEPGTWAELKTIGLTEAIGKTGGSSDTSLAYSDEGKWNPSTKQFFFKGGDHNAVERFVSYDAVTNAWKIESHPPWMPTGITQNHAYDYQAIDMARQIYYYVNERYDILTKSWLSALPVTGLPNFGRAHHAQEYFPGLGLVRIGDGGAYLFDESVKKWITLATGLAFAGLHPIAEYSPVHNVMIFGGGDESNQVYKLDGSKTVTPLQPAPVPSIGIYWSVLTVDPVGGDHLLVEGHNKQFWKYDVIADEWTQLNLPLPLFNDLRYNNLGAYSIIASPVNNEGVVMFVQYTGSLQGKVFLYKHSASSPKVTGPTAPPNLRTN